MSSGCDVERDAADPGAGISRPTAFQIAASGSDSMIN